MKIKTKYFVLFSIPVILWLIALALAQGLGGSTTRTVNCSDTSSLTADKQTYIIAGETVEYTEQYLCKLAEYREYVNTQMLVYTWNETEYIKCFVGTAEYLEDSKLINLTKSIDDLKVENCNAIGCDEIYNYEYCY